MIRTRKPDKSLSTLIKELDGHFSKFIRFRDSKDGKVICFTCGAKMMLQESQCGHFIDRDQMPTRYDEMNCHAVCEECNCFDPDHINKYKSVMMVRYGEVEIYNLMRKSRGLQKFARFELEELIEYYKSENRLKRKQP